MTEDRMALVELLQKSGDPDFPRAVTEAVLQILMEADVEGLIGAGRHDRAVERLNYRTGYLATVPSNPARDAEPAHPKAMPGLLFSALLGPRKTAEKALITVIQEARIGGVPTRRVAELVQAIGLSGISKSQVSNRARTSTSGSMPCSIAPIDANGRISGSTRPT